MNRSIDPSFDSAAATYDDEFTFSEIGKLQRERVYYWLDKLHFFKQPQTVFEVNCGTGYDAQFFTERGHSVIATDGSEQMVKVAQSRNSKLTVYQRNFNDISIDDNVRKSDVIFSNFGGLNCLSAAELATFVDDTALLQKKDDLLIAVIMPNHCFIADVYHLMKGKFKQVGRRNKKGSLEVDVNGEKIRTYYHSPNRLTGLLRDKYCIELKKPVAAFLPPSYLESFFKRNPQVLNGLYSLERIFGNLNFLSSLADHYILVAKRK